MPEKTEYEKTFEKIAAFAAKKKEEIMYDMDKIKQRSEKVKLI